MQRRAIGSWIHCGVSSRGRSGVRSCRVECASTVWRFAGRALLLAQPWRHLESWAMQLKAEGQKTQGSA